MKGMGKIIGFSAMEILPSLLSREKTQTIRPAWIRLPSGFIADKLPRFKVGDKAQLMWQPRIATRFFYRANGMPVPEFVVAKHSKETEIFPKFLGQVEITEVFKITIGKNVCGSEEYTIGSDFNTTHEELAHQDGFNSAEDMFKWFDKAYDLSQPKEFYVYRWRYTNMIGQSVG